MSVGISGSNTKDHSQSNQNNTGYGTQTPNNLPFLQAGWNVASNTLAPTTATSPLLSSAGSSSALSAVPQAQTTANAGASAATDFANGAHTTNDANQYLTPTAQGSYLDAQNPAFQSVVRQTAQALQPEIDGPAAAAGRYGSGANANAFDTALTNATSGMSFQNYVNERQNQLAAAGQLSTNNATGNQQQLEGASLTPSTTSNLFTPSTGATTAAYAPLLAYIAAITQGNAGGTQSQFGNVNFTGNDNKTTIGGGAGTGGMFGSAAA